jgi:hypothetical protein
MAALQLGTIAMGDRIGGYLQRQSLRVPDAIE